MRFSNRIFAVTATMLAVTLAFLVSSSLALAQAGDDAQSAPGSSAASSAVNPASIDDATLKHTAKAFVKVTEIVQTAQQAVDNTADDAKKEQIAQQAQSKEMAAVKAEGLQPAQYNHVLQVAQADDAFQQKFLSYVKKVKNSPSESD
jgi:Domain of unknown function (DUF4168)